jgi:secreted trypsin-like serine protease
LRSEKTKAIGGNTIRNERLWGEVVALLDGRKQAFCTGILIDQTKILTAAHCICDKPKYIYFGRNAQRGIAHPSRVFKLRAENAGGYWLPEDANCKKKTTLKGRDYGVLVLDRRPERAHFRFTPAVLPTKGTDNSLSLLKEMYTVGFGTRQHPIEGKGIEMGVKNFVTVPILSQKCNRTADLPYGCLAGKELLSVDPSGEHRKLGACKGDSGGGAYIREEPRGLVLVGIVSRVSDNALLCGDGAIYTLLTSEVLASIENSH